MELYDSHGRGEYDIQSLCKDPNVIRKYLKTGEKPPMTAAQNDLFMRIMELFKTIQSIGKLDYVLGDPKQLEAIQLNMFD